MKCTACDEYVAVGAAKWCYDEPYHPACLELLGEKAEMREYTQKKEKDDEHHERPNHHKEKPND